MNNPNFERITTKRTMSNEDFVADETINRRRKRTKQFERGRNKHQLDRTLNSTVNALGYLPKY